MTRTLSILAGLALGGTLAALPARAQATTPLATGRGGSAHVKSTWALGGAHIAVEYGRPALKGRAESQMMPAGHPWRTGADAATVLTTDRTLTFGAVTLAPGSYTINTEPGESGWQLLIGTLKAPGQWGIPYQQSLEIGRAPMTLTRAKAPVELLTIDIVPTGTGGVLRIEWGTTSVSVPFTIKG